MGLDLGTLTINLRAETAEFKKKMAEIEKSVHDFTKQLEPIAKTSAVAFAGLSASIALVTKAAGEDILNEMRLTSVFKENTDALAGYAAALERQTGFSQDASIESLKLMGTMGLNAAQAKALLPRIQDLSALMGTDLSSATMLATKAINNGSQALQRSGVAMTEQQKATFDSLNQAGRFAMMMDLLGSKAGGMADKMRGTVPGALQALKSSFGSLVDELGVGFQGPAMDALNTLIDGVQRATEWFKNLTPEAKSFLAEMALGATVVAGIATAITGVAVALPTLIAGFTALGAAITGAVIPALPYILMIGVAIAGVILHIGLLRKAWDANLFGIRDAVTKFIDWHVKAFTDGFTAIGRLFDWLVEANYQMLDTIKAGWAGFINAHKQMVSMLTFGKVQFEQSTWTPTERGQAGKMAGGAATAVAGGVGAAGSFVADTFKTGLNTVLDPIKAAFKDLLPSVVALNEASFNVTGSLGDVGLNSDAAAEALKKLSDEAEKAALPKFGEFNLADPTASLSTKEWQLQQPGELSMPKVPESVISADELKLKLDPAFENGALALGTAVTKSTDMFGTEMMKVTDTFLDSFLPKLGVAGEVIGAALQGFNQGGIWGAIAAVVATLLSKGEAFVELVNLLSTFVYWLVGLLNPILQSFLPILASLLQIFQVFVMMWTMWLRLLGGVLIQLAPAIQQFANIVGNVVAALIHAWNWIVNQLARIVSWIPKVGDDIADAIRAMQVSTAEVVGLYAAQVPPANDGLDTLGTTATTAATSISAMTESLTNVPEGFKVALARFRATAGESVAFSPGQSSASGGMYNIEQVVVQANNPEEFEKKLSERAKFSAYRAGGTPIQGAPVFVGG